MSRELRYGLLAGFVTIAWMALGYALHWEASDMGKYAPYLSLLILFVTTYFAILMKRDRDLQGVITFKQAVFTGMAVCFVIGLMVGTFLLVYIKFVNPEYVNTMVEQAGSYYKSQNATQEQIDKGVESMKAMYSPFGQFTYGIGTTMLTGLLISVVIGAIMQRKVKKS